MRYSEDFLAELKSRVRLSDYIGRSVKLKRQGREYAGLSPFTKEKSPSFFVNDDKGFYHCFSSGKHGDLIAFLQETQRLSFHEAVEALAGEAGMQLPARDARAAEDEKRRNGLSDWLTVASSWFQAELRRLGGDGAREYLLRRGLPADEWATYGIGYAPIGRTSLKDYLVAKGARPAELIAAGLLVTTEGGGETYDRFRGRIMFPIVDARGRLVSFGGRALNPDARAKYLNGPDTAIFDKGRTLYGLHHSRRMEVKDFSLVVVEGYMDVIACQRAGVPAVSPMGTALTENQLDLLWRYCPEPTLCFDGDAAGRRAVGRAIERALPALKPGRSLGFAIVEGGKDPDDILRDHGPDALREQLAVTTPFAEALFQQEIAGVNLDKPDDKAALRRRLREAARAIPDRDLAQEYEAHLDEKFKRLVGRGGPSAAPLPTSDLPPVGAALVKAAMADPSRLERFVEIAHDFSIGHRALEDVFQLIVDSLMDPDRSLLAGILERGHGALLEKIERTPDTYADPELWADAVGRIIEHGSLDRAVQEAKASLRTPEDMAAFTALKTRRDAAKKALPR